MPGSHVRVEWPLDTTKWSYSVDNATLMRFDIDDLKCGSIYALRVVAFKTGLVCAPADCPNGHWYCTEGAAEDEPYFFDLPARVEMIDADTPDMIALAVRVHGQPMKLSLVCVPLQMRIDDNKWVCKEDYQYVKLDTIKKVKKIMSADGVNKVTELNEFMKKHCKLFSGIGVPKNLKSARDWVVERRWKSNVNYIMDNFTLDIKRSIKTATGARQSNGKSAGDEAAATAEAADLQRKLAAIKICQKDLLELNKYYTLPVHERIYRLTKLQISKLPLPPIGSEEAANKSACCAVYNKHQETKRSHDKEYWARLQGGEAEPPPPSSPTIRATIIKFGVSTGLSSPFQLAPSRTTEAIADLRAEQEQEQIEGQNNVEEADQDEADGEEEYPDNGEFPESPGGEDEGVNEPRLNAGARATRHAGKPPPKPPKSPAKAKTTPTRSKKRQAGGTTTAGLKRQYNKGSSWYMRYGKSVPASVRILEDSPQKPKIGAFCK